MVKTAKKGIFAGYDRLNQAGGGSYREWQLGNSND